MQCLHYNEIIYFFQRYYLIVVLQLTEASFTKMHKLFSLSFRRIANRLNQTELNALNVAQSLQNSQIAAYGEGFLYRLPREQLKHILNVSCPINNLQDPTTPTIVASSKALRHHAKIKEDKICFKCPFRQNCLSAKQPFTGTLDNTPKDLLIFWSGLANLTKTDQILYRHWVSAYKITDNIISALDDLSQGGKEVEQLQKLRLQVLKFNLYNKPSEDTQSLKENKVTLQTKETKKNVTKKINQQDNIAGNPFQKKGDLPPHLQQQVHGRDFSFDQVEQFEPKDKFSKDSFKQKKQFKDNKYDQSKGEKGYKFIERNENTKFQKNNQFKQKKTREFQEEEDFDEVPRSKGKNYRSNSDYQYDRRSNYDNRKNDYNSTKRYRNDQNFQRQPRQQNYKKFNKKYDNRRYQQDQQNFRQRGNNYKGFQRSDNYQNRNYDQRQNQRDNYRQFNERRPNRNYQQNQDSKFSKKYQRDDYQTDRQRQQKKANKPNPFVSKWSPSQDLNDDFDLKEFKQSKARKQQQRNQAKEKSQAKPTVKIIQTENIQKTPQTQARASRNLRRRGRTASNPDIQTTTQ